MGLGRLNPGCNNCGCLPVINCPPCPVCKCHGDDSCILSHKTITVTLQLASWTLNQSTHIQDDFLFEPYIAILQCGTSGIINMLNPYHPGFDVITPIPPLLPFFYEFTDTGLYIIHNRPLGPITTPQFPAVFGFSSTCSCPTWLTQEFTQTNFPNVPWAHVYSWLDPNGWLSGWGPYFIVLRSVERGLFAL